MGQNCTEINWNLDVPVGIVHRQGDGRPISPSSIPGRGNRILLSPKRTKRPRDPSSLLFKRYQGWILLDVKRPGDKVDQLSASASEINNEWSYISSTSPFAFKTCTSSILCTTFPCLEIFAPNVTYLPTVLYDTGQFVDTRLTKQWCA